MNTTLQLTKIATNDKIEFREFPVIIGRDSTADLQLDDPTLPPYQCMIGELADYRAVVWNLKNDSPLYVNGGRTTRADLLPGDILTIGRNRFVFSREAVPRPPLTPSVKSHLQPSTSRNSGSILAALVPASGPLPDAAAPLSMEDRS